MTIEAYTY